VASSSLYFNCRCSVFACISFILIVVPNRFYAFCEHSWGNGATTLRNINKCWMVSWACLHSRQQVWGLANLLAVVNHIEFSIVGVPQISKFASTGHAWSTKWRRHCRQTCDSKFLKLENFQTCYQVHLAVGLSHPSQTWTYSTKVLTDEVILMSSLNDCQPALVSQSAAK